MDHRHEPTVAKDHASAVPSDDEESSDDEFEFPFVTRDAAPADELFAGGRVRAFYPVFGQVLDDPLPEEPAEPPKPRVFKLEKARASSVASTSSSTSSSTGELDGASPDSYCLWTPGSSLASSPSRPPRKSGSTGSMSRWRRIGELVVGRSHSDGREKFVFLSAPPSPVRDHAASSSPSRAKQQQARESEVTEVAAGRRMSYGGANKASVSSGTRRTFLPYRQELVGLFANVHGLSRSHHHPF
jgi:hypothetical protein